MRIFMSAIAASFIVASPALANPPLAEVESVREALITAGMVVEIDEKCDDISMRLVRGYSFLQNIEKDARDRGYSDAEIEAYTDDDAEKDRLEAIARDRLVALGAVPGNGASYCAVGQAQIDARTEIGRLLR